MANDLSKAAPRTTQQDRITRNRDAMFRRNDTEAPQRRIFGDMRNASRGDGGAQALMEALGMVERGARGFQQYANNKFEEDERQAGSQGLIDASTGNVDEAQMAKSRAYRESVSLGRAQRSWAEGLSGFDAEVQELLVNQDSPDPETRKAEVASLLEDYFHRFAIGEDGQLRDFGSPAANRWLAEQMAGTRQNAMVKAAEAIDERLGAESVANMTATVRAQLVAGQDVDWSTVLGGLLPTVDRKAAMGDLLVTVKDVAMTLEEQDPVRAVRILDGLLGFAASSGIQQIDPGASVAAAEDPQPHQLLAPFAGFAADNVRSRIGAARAGSSHNGEDFPVPVGTPIVAPMDGKVVSSFRNARGGHQVIVELDNGARVGFAHLSSRGVKEGDRVEAGAQLGLSGNTGKSTGPHVHMTMTVGGRKVSPSEYFAQNPTAVGASRPTTDPLQPGVLDPATPSELAAQAGGGQLTPPTGALQLTAEQRLDLLEFRRSFRKAVDTKAEQRLDEERSNVAYEFIARTSGVGAYPTSLEVQEAIREGRITPQAGATILNTMEADRRQAETDVRSAQSQANGLETETKEQRVENAVATILGPVYRGRETPAQASARVLEEAASIEDVEVRRAVISAVSAEINGIASLRTKTPEYQRAARDFDDWEQTYVRELANRRLPRGVTREQAQALIRQRLDGWATQIGSGGLKPDKVDDYLKRAEPQLDRWFDQTFPRRNANRPN